MPFSDQQLADRMRTELVFAGVMTEGQLTTLLDDPTERRVLDLLGQPSVDAFRTYWSALGSWLSMNSGSLAFMSGTNAPGRREGRPSGLMWTAIYNDAFADTNRHIESDGFMIGKAISNNLRFISIADDFG